MKLMLLAAIFALITPICRAECGGFADSDRISDIKRKLACWERENSQLEAEKFAILSASNDIYVYLSFYSLEKMSPDKCKNRALAALTARGAQVSSHGNYYITATLGSARYQLSCSRPEASYVVIAARVIDQSMKDMAASMVQNTFIDP